jgi:hypothetical protein
MGSEVSFSDPYRSGKAGSGDRDPGDMRVCGLRGGGAECAAGPCTSGGDNSAEGIDIGAAGAVRGSDIDEAVPPVSVFEEEAVLGESLLVEGYCVDTVGLDADMIRKYVRYQEKKEQQLEQLQLCD